MGTESQGAGPQNTELTPAAGVAQAASPPLTMADVKSLIDSAVGPLGETLKKLTPQSVATATARQTYADAKMSDLPDTYRSMLPQSGNSKDLAAAEQTIRAQYRADLGDKFPVANTASSGGAAMVEPSRGSAATSAYDSLSAALKQRAAERQSGAMTRAVSLTEGPGK